MGNGTQTINSNLGSATPQNRQTQATSGQSLPANPRQYTYDYPLPSVSVDIILFSFQNSQLTVLLIQRKFPPFDKCWALPGGFMKIDEDLEAAAMRKLKEETNVDDVYLEQLYTFGCPNRDPRTRVITVAYFSLLSTEEVANRQVRSGGRADDARWWNIYDLPDLAFDHRTILDYALQRLRWKLEWTALGFFLLPSEFTLSELQQVYETVLNEPQDKRNFRRKMLASKIEDVKVLEETGKKRGGEHRPAKLYRFGAKAIELELAKRRLP
ncbi:MAG: NUDIX domain-containing protein [Chloroflexota bacterium]